MGVVYSSESSVLAYHTTQRHNPTGHNKHVYACKTETIYTALKLLSKIVGSRLR